jgi:hypothetical protein
MQIRFVRESMIHMVTCTRGCAGSEWVPTGLVLVHSQLLQVLWLGPSVRGLVGVSIVMNAEGTVLSCRRYMDDALYVWLCRIVYQMTGSVMTFHRLLCATPAGCCAGSAAGAVYC